MIFQIGKLKKRIYPRDVTLILGKDAPIPECPIPGERFGLILPWFIRKKTKKKKEREM